MGFKNKLLSSLSPLPPPAPAVPPPPPPPLPMESNQFQFSTRNTNNFLSYEEELSLAYDRIKACEDFTCKIFLSHHLNLEPQLQVGPQCGLVALSIASTVTQNPVNVNNIFQTALALGYTKQGEIFDAKFLADLAEKCCGFKAKTIKGELKFHVQCIINNLLRKNLILIPYDADHNHSPCCKNGQKAHWAVISGFVIFSAADDENGGEVKDAVAKLDSKYNYLCSCEESETSTKDGPIKFIYDGSKILITKTPNVDEVTFNDAKESRIYLIGRQGKSKHVGLWLFDKMSESNDNLILFSKTREIDNYVLPQGGLPEGLKGKAIILKTNFPSQ